MEMGKSADGYMESQWKETYRILDERLQLLSKNSMAIGMSVLLRAPLASMLLSPMLSSRHMLFGKECPA